jgi:hypothetical protein
VSFSASRSTAWFPLHGAFVAAAAALITSCASGGARTTSRISAAGVDINEVRALENALADDSMQGRATGSAGSAKAATLIARAMQLAGLRAGGDSGYFQRVPVAMAPGRNNAMRPRGFPSFEALDTVPAERRRTAVNVVGILPGSDPALQNQWVVVDAHYDHIGIGTPVNGDSIFNGADDDASGTVAVLEIAKAIAGGPAPKRSLLFVATTGEEVGLIGTRWFIEHPPVPFDSIVANLEIEMIGRPDSLAGGSGKGWLTGYERSTMGASLKTAGVPIVPDPRPAQNFFQRSDNIAFARRGIPAHTLSSFNLHTDYHRVTDDVSHVDFAHMTAVIEAAVKAVRILADGPRIQWNDGGRP